MIIEYNKFNIALYFITGSVIAISFKRWIYGSIIVIMSLFILLQYIVLNSDLYKYQNITKIPSGITLLLLIIASLFILGKSSITNSKKLFSIIFLVLSLGFSISKVYLKNKPIFDLSISNYISSLLFILVLISISIIPDNQNILERPYYEIKDKKIKN